jgi:hypothetical protein
MDDLSMKSPEELVMEAKLSTCADDEILRELRACRAMKAKAEQWAQDESCEIMEQAIALDILAAGEEAK